MLVGNVTSSTFTVPLDDRILVLSLSLSLLLEDELSSFLDYGTDPSLDAPEVRGASAEGCKKTIILMGTLFSRHSGVRAGRYGENPRAYPFVSAS